MKIIFATHNKGKLKEMMELLPDFDVLSAEEAGVFEDVEEDGKTFAENALKKARFVSENTLGWSVADDSGICIDALDGKPGIMSARWAGERSTDEDKINLTLEKIKDVPKEKRGAFFESVVALVSPDNQEWTFSGKVEGKITNEPHGINRPNLPYDLIFIPNGKELTFAQMSDEEKNIFSHRGQAFRKLKKFLDNLN